ncbi:hypothetical protein CN383_16210 [Priestia megaterium]|uniref:glycosyltransferase family 4 protein n=1 Tax=Priestia megaterium TaxID=1404 RepID=UPI000BF53CB9|nr:glycosyltransferase family 4 protein [Priestia megaterium]PFA99194.1 hypothetical protein CN383_16210 [Priestia megaterium]
MNKKVILSSNISHYNYTARALEEKGHLKKYITGAQFSKTQYFFNFFPKKVANQLIDRIDSELPNEKIFSMWKLEILYKFFLATFSRNRDKIINIHNNLYDIMASRKVEKCDAFHFVSSIGYRSALKAKSLGSTIVLDDRAQHPLFLEELLNEEFEAIGIDKKAEVSTKSVLLKEYEIADYIIVASEFAKRTFIEQGIKEDKIFVVPYGYESKKFFPSNKIDDTFRVLFVGQITPRKGVKYLLDAFKKLPKDNTELILIGKIDSTMQFIMEELPENVIHYEYIPNVKLNEFYSNSDIFVLPSLSDAFGLVVLEALGAGLPVLLSENVGAADLIQDGKEGYIVPIRDAEAIYSKLFYLFNNRGEIEKMRNHCVQTSSLYNWDYYMKKLNEVYEAIL